LAEGWHGNAMNVVIGKAIVYAVGHAIAGITAAAAAAIRRRRVLA
jgi:hypothetical protein